jgi:SAM-dependent methyltransferase
MAILPGSRVLDIGAGPGTYAVPLAERGCRVTAVEPSPVMREALEERLSRDPDLVIEIVPRRWEDVTMEDLAGSFDVVFASYSLTMVDIADAVAKMADCCTGTVHLFWFLTSPPWVKVNRDLWPLLHGGEFPGQPTADWLWQILVEMGIYANLAVETKFPPAVFESVEAAVADYLMRLNCTSDEQRTTVTNYFSSVLRRTDAGYVLDGGTLGAHIWWDVPRSVEAANKGG